MKLPDLPLDVFRHVIDHAVPTEASDLDPNTFRAHRSTAHLQLVKKPFYREVTRQLFVIRPLQIRVFDSTPLRDLTSGRIPDLSSIQRNRERLNRGCYHHSLYNVWAVPLHRFRRIYIHLIPLLALVNVASGLELSYFRSADTDQQASSLTEQYKLVLDLQHQIILERARGISDGLAEIEGTHSAISSRRTSFKLFFHDSPEDIIPSYLLPNTMYTFPRAPIKQLAFFPRSTNASQEGTALFATSPNLPMWSPSDVLRVMENFNPLHDLKDDRMDLATYSTFDETIHLPSTLACLHHDTTKSTTWHHNYWHQRLRQCFTHSKDSARNIDLGADSLQNWYTGRTNVTATRLGDTS